MQKLTVYGLPLNPSHLLNQLKGASFCVSYATRDKLGKQLDQAISLVGEDSILLVDNGAFSHFMSGGSMTPEYIEGFEAWAEEILDRCPQAVVVIPDVIGGTWKQNAELAESSVFYTSDRAMPIWHTNEPISYLLALCERFQYIGFGSTKEYAPGSKEWHAKMVEAFAAIDAWEKEDGAVRPRIHMMRAQAQAHLYPFDSSDSTNVAVNHNRWAKTNKVTERHVAKLAARVDAKIQASAGPEAYHQQMRPLRDHEIQAAWEAERNTMIATMVLIEKGILPASMLREMPDHAAIAAAVKASRSPAQKELFAA